MSRRPLDRSTTAPQSAGYSLPVRLLMGVVGLTLLTFYVLLALASYVLVRTFVGGLFDGDLLSTLLVLALLTVAFGFLSYQFGTAQLLSALDVDAVPRSRAPELYRRIDDLADRMGVDPPTVAVARMEAPNALAIGGRGGGTVIFDGRLFRLLDASELEGILAHELAHLDSRDSLVQTLAYSFARTLVGLLVLALLPVTLLLRGVGRAGAWLRGRPRDRGGVTERLRAVTGRGVLVVFLVLTLLVRAHSRRREFAADERAAAVTGRPLALARALRKIERAGQPGGGLLSPLYVHAEEEDPLTRLLSTHPPMDARVERLVELAGTDGARDGDRRVDVRVR